CFVSPFAREARESMALPATSLKNGTPRSSGSRRLPALAGFRATQPAARRQRRAHRRRTPWVTGAARPKRATFGRGAVGAEPCGQSGGGQVNPSKSDGHDVDALQQFGFRASNGDGCPRLGGQRIRELVA